VPIGDYEAFRPWVARIVAGERRVLTAETPFMFTATSGTTGEPKLVPVTASWAGVMAALMRLWTVHALRDHPAMLDGHVLAMVSPAVEGVTPGGLPYGAMTGLTFQRLPWPIRRRHAVPYAAALGRVVEGHGRLVLGECWPDLSLVACWLGGSAGIQARHLDAHFGPRVARRDLGLVASEGRLTIPVGDHSAAGVLAVHANFFEFVPEEAIEEATPRTLLAHELEVGRRYYVIVTGGNGLYRYDLNDIVEVQGFHRRTPKVAFVRKGRDMVNITGEK